MNRSLYSRTPTVTVLDNRSLGIRNIAYHRHPDTPSITDERIIRHQYDARGFMTLNADPRLHKNGMVNFTWLNDLAGTVLRTISADAGTTLSLGDAIGREFISVTGIRTADDGTQDLSQAVTRTWQYEESSLAGRLLGLTEQRPGTVARIVDRFVYAGNTDAEKNLNLAGQCVCHFDTAGLAQVDSIALNGVPLSATRRLLKDADSPDNVANWQGEDTSAWNVLLAGEAFTSLTTTDATGTMLTTTDALGNRQRATYDVAGLLSGSWLTLKDGREQIIVKSLTYSAAGQTLREEHGNGVVTTWTYEPETQWLIGVKTERPVGHTSGAKILQDLRYEYDPVGNVLRVTNNAEETRFWRNQKVVPENTYTYDSLYQLIRATGREMANAGQQASNRPSVTVPFPSDSTAYTHYTRRYTYDAAENLTQIKHSAPATSNSYTTDITISNSSNRGVLSTLTTVPSEVDALFTAGGQQRQLLPGRVLHWTPRNELLKVMPVVRGDIDDTESYRYDGGSQRMLKVSVQKTGNSIQTRRVQYLPGLQLHVMTNGGSEKENWQVITPGEAGSAQVRALHWVTGKPAEISNDSLRYSYDNLTGSGQLELDGEGNVISQEEYYPYGGTAIWTARSMVEAEYKTVRYSGREQDATGLYYYGYRYYQPWAGRWLSADPAGTVDGLNLFGMCNNNPISNVDDSGLFTFNIVKAINNRNASDRANLSYGRMYAGKYWERKISDKRSFSKVSRNNIKKLRKDNANLSENQLDFIERFKKIDINLVHFSNANLISKGRAIFRSRNDLVEKKILFPQGNTWASDMFKLKTEDFSFFSIGIGNAAGKPSSRFGDTKYTIKMSDIKNNKYIKHSHISINDTLHFDYRETSMGRLIDFFGEKDAETLKGEYSLTDETHYSKVAKSAIETVFSYKDFREGLALRIVDTAKTLSEKSRQKIYGARTDSEFDNILSLLYRPQFLVPKKLDIAGRKVAVVTK